MLDSQQIDAVAEFLEQEGVSEDTVRALREKYQGCHFTYCMDDDVNAKAYLERPQFNLYLVDSRDHCSVLTTDHTHASGVVVAEVIE